MQEEWYRLPNGQYVNIPRDLPNNQKVEIIKGLADEFPKEIGEPYYQAYNEYLKGQRTIGGTIQQSLLNLGRGLAATGLAVPEAIAATLTPHKDVAAERNLRDLRERLMGSIPEEYRQDEWANIAMGLGQYGGFGLAALAGGWPAAATLGISTGVSEADRRKQDYENVTGEDVSTGKEILGLTGGAAIGFTEAFPVLRAGKRLAAAEKMVRSRWFGNVAWTAVEEAAQEGAAEVGQSFIADVLYNDKALENLGSRVLDNARLGGEVGGIATALAEIYSGYRRRGMLGANFIEAEYAMARPEWTQEELEAQDRAGQERADRSNATEGSTRWQQLFNLGVNQKRTEQHKALYDTLRQQHIAGLDTAPIKKRLGINPELLNPLMEHINSLEAERIAATEADQDLTDPEKRDILGRIARTSEGLRDQLNNPDEIQNPTSILNRWFSGNWDSIFENIRVEYLRSLADIDISRLADNPNLSNEDFSTIVENDRIMALSGGEPDSYREWLGITEADQNDQTGFSAAVVMRMIDVGGNLNLDDSQLWTDPIFHLQSQESMQARQELERRINNPDIYTSQEFLLSPQKTIELVDRLVTGKNKNAIRSTVKGNLFNIRAGVNLAKWVAHHNLSESQIARAGRTIGQPKIQRDRQQIEKDLNILFQGRKDAVAAFGIDPPVGRNAVREFDMIMEGKNIIGIDNDIWDQLVNRLTGLNKKSQLTASGGSSGPNFVQKAQIRAFMSGLMNLPEFRTGSEVQLLNSDLRGLRGEFVRPVDRGVQVSEADARKGSYPSAWYREMVRVLGKNRTLNNAEMRDAIWDYESNLPGSYISRGPSDIMTTLPGLESKDKITNKQLDNVRKDLIANGHAQLNKVTRQQKAKDPSMRIGSTYIEMPVDARTRPPPSLREIFEIDQEQRLNRLAEERGVTVDELKTQINYDGAAQLRAGQELNKVARKYLETVHKFLDEVGLGGRVMPILEAEIGSKWEAAPDVLINNEASQREGALARFDGPTATIAFSLSNIDPEGTMNMKDFEAAVIEEIDHALIRYGSIEQRFLGPLLDYGLNNKVKKETDTEGFERDETYMESVERTYGHLLKSGEYTSKDMEEEVIVAVLGDIRAGVVAPKGQMGKARKMADRITEAIRGASRESGLYEIAELIRGRKFHRPPGVGRLKPDVSMAARGEGVGNLYFYDRTSPELNKEMGQALNNLRKATLRGADQKELRTLEQKVFQVRQKVRGEHKNMYSFLDPPKITDAKKIQNRMRVRRDETDTPMGEVPLVNPNASDIALDEFYSIREGNSPFQIPEAVKYKMRRETSVTDLDYEDIGLSPPDPNAEPRPLMYEQVLKALGADMPDGAEDAFNTLDRLRENIADALYRVSEQSREVHEQSGYVQVMANEAAISILRLRNNAMNAAAGAYYEGPPVFTGDDPYSGTAIFTEDGLPALKDALDLIRDPGLERIAIEYGTALRIISLDEQVPTIAKAIQDIQGIEEQVVDSKEINVRGIGGTLIPTVPGRGENEGKRVLLKKKGTLDILLEERMVLAGNLETLRVKPWGDLVDPVDPVGDDPVQLSKIAEMEQQIAEIDHKIEYQEDLLYELRQMLSAARAKHGSPMNPEGLNPTTARRIIDKVDNHPRNVLIREQVPKFWETFRQHNLGNIQFAEDTWIIKPEIAAIWREMSYMPFYREVGTEAQAALNSVWGKGFRQRKETSPTLEPDKMKKAISVERPLIGSLLPMKQDLSANLIRHSTALYYDGIQNVSGLRVVRDAKTLKILGNPDPDWEGRVIRREKASDRTIRVLEQGQQVYYEHVDPMLAASVMSLGFNPAKAIEEWLGGGAFGQISSKAILGTASGLRESIVRTPAFQSDNFWRDVIQAWAVVGGDKDLFIRAIKNVFSKTSVPRARRLGIAMSPDFLSNPDKLGEHQRKEWERTRVPFHKAGIKAPIRAASNVWAWLGRMGNQTEVATRLAIAERVLADGGTEAEAQFAGINIMDYGRRGKNPLWQIFTAWNPFMNGRMVGMDTFYRGVQGTWDAPAPLSGAMLTPESKTYRRMSAAVLGRLLQMSMVSGIYYMFVHDEPWWKELTESEKMDGMILPPGPFNDPLSGGKAAIFMPSPFESGLVGYTLPLALLRTMFERDYGLPKLGGEAKRQLDTTLAFHIFPQIYRPFYNAYKNWDEFRRDKIIPPHFEEDVDPALQYDYRTSNISHAVSSIFAKTPIVDKTFMSSPMKMEYMIRQYFGTMGAYASTITDSMIRRWYTKQGVTDTPMHFSASLANVPPINFLRIVKDMDRGGGYQEWFYELNEVLDGVVASMNEASNQKEWDRYEKISQTNQMILKHQDRMRAHANWLADWRKRRDVLMSYKNLTGEQEKLRDQAYRELRDIRIERGRQLYDLVSKDTPSYYEKLAGSGS